MTRREALKSLWVVPALPLAFLRAPREKVFHEYETLTAEKLNAALDEVRG